MWFLMRNASLLILYAVSLTDTIAFRAIYRNLATLPRRCYNVLFKETSFIECNLAMTLMIIYCSSTVISSKYYHFRIVLITYKHVNLFIKNKRLSFNKSCRFRYQNFIKIFSCIVTLLKKLYVYFNMTLNRIHKKFYQKCHNTFASSLS